LRAIALLAILLLIWLGLLTLPLLAFSGFVAVCGTVVYSVAAPALVPSLVEPQLLPAANARIELARTIAFASGPALGGVLVGWLVLRPHSVSPRRSRSSRWCCFRECLSRTGTRPRRHPLQEIKEGAAFVLHHRLLRPVFITQFIFNTASFCCSRCSCPMRCTVSACRRPASARRWRCTVWAWWPVRSRRRG